MEAILVLNKEFVLVLEISFLCLNIGSKGLRLGLILSLVDSPSSFSGVGGCMEGLHFPAVLDFGSCLFRRKGLSPVFAEYILISLN